MLRYDVEQPLYVFSNRFARTSDLADGIVDLLHGRGEKFLECNPLNPFLIYRGLLGRDEHLVDCWRGVEKGLKQPLTGSDVLR